MPSPQLHPRAPGQAAKQPPPPRSTCCVCGNPEISLRVRTLAAFGARTRCRRCGSVLRAARAVRWARVPFDAVAILGALWLMAHTSRAGALALFVGVSALPVSLGIHLPLEADPRDPITRRAIARRRS